jgi:hypothetical protein
MLSYDKDRIASEDHWSGLGSPGVPSSLLFRPIRVFWFRTFVVGPVSHGCMPL